MPYNFVADSFHTKKLFSRISSIEVRLQLENGSFAFLSRLLCLLGIRDNVPCSSWSFWKARMGLVDFVLVLIELFSLRCYG